MKPFLARLRHLILVSYLAFTFVCFIIVTAENRPTAGLRIIECLIYGICRKSHKLAHLLPNIARRTSYITIFTNRTFSSLAKQIVQSMLYAIGSIFQILTKKPKTDEKQTRWGFQSKEKTILDNLPEKGFFVRLHEDFETTKHLAKIYSDELEGLVGYHLSIIENPPTDDPDSKEDGIDHGLTDGLTEDPHNDKPATEGK